MDWIKYPEIFTVKNNFTFAFHYFIVQFLISSGFFFRFYLSVYDTFFHGWDSHVTRQSKELGFGENQWAFLKFVTAMSFGKL